MSSDEVEPHAPVKQEAEPSSCDLKGEVFSAEQKNSPSPQTSTPPGMAMGVITEMEADDLVFSDDAFPSLPDFPCLSSPSTTASPLSAAPKKPKDPCLGNTSSSISSSSSSSASSSSSSPWSILNAATASEAMQPAPACDVDSVVANDDIDEALPQYCDEFDILREMELWDTSETSDTWDNSSSLVPAENAGSASQLQSGVNLLGGGEDGECPSEDLAKVFLDWLKNNKDSISPEDLRNITLKRSTIECAARRLGGGKQGRVQLLKLILAWVQNHHLHKRRRRNRGMRDRMDEADLSVQLSYPLPLNANPTLTPETAVNPHTDYNYEAAPPPPPCNSWVPFSAEPSSFPAMISGYGGEAAPYHFYNGQPFSPLGTPEFPAELAAVWPQGLSAAAGVPYHAFGMGPTSPHLPSVPASQYTPGFVSHYPGGQNMYNPRIGLAGVASATKEARKKRMARQRRFSSLHHLRGQQNQQQHCLSTADPLEQSSLALNDGGSGSSAISHVNNSRNWAFWSSLPSSSSQQASSQPQKLLGHTPALPTPPMAQIPQKNPEKHASAVDRNQGWKAEKNLRFLLQKVLKQSDVGSLGRIVLPKKEAEIHLPELDARDGISIEMEDIGTSRVWNMRYRFWPNNKSRMYLLENTGDFVRSNGLQEGDFIVIYSDVKCGKYMIRGVKVRQPVDGKAVGRSNGKPHQKKEKDGSQNCKVMAVGRGDGAAEGKGNS